jgi:hypothetical protein
MSTPSNDADERREQETGRIESTVDDSPIYADARCNRKDLVAR